MVKFRENRLNGLFPLSYIGVNPVSPQNFIMNNGAPTPNDSKNFYIGDLWLDTSSDTSPNYIPPTVSNLYILTSLDRGIATWQPFAGGTSSVVTLTGNTGGPAPPTAGNINVIGDGITVNVAGTPGTSTLTISAIGTGVVDSLTGDTGPAVAPVAGNINVITSVVTQNAGSTASFSGTGNTLTFNSTDVLSNTIFENHRAMPPFQNGNNTSFGANSMGNVTSGGGNSAFGQGSMSSLTTGSQNDALGEDTFGLLTTGSTNLACGNNSLLNIVTGSNNIAVGFSAGSSLATSDSSNIVLGNIGTGGDNNTIRIGTQGAGAGQQNLAFMAGIVGNTVSNQQLVTINSATGQLGVTTSAPLMTAGTWTPNLTIGGSSVGITYLFQQGNLMRFNIGTGPSLVYISATITLTSIGGLTGDLAISNLPFTTFTPVLASGIGLLGPNVAVTLADDIAWVQVGGDGVTTLSFLHGSYAGGSFGVMNDTMITNNSSFGFQLMYQAV